MKIKHYLIAILTLGVLGACSKDYLDINQSPTSPTQDLVAPDLLLAGAINAPYRTLAVTANDLGNAWMQNWGPNVNAWTGGYEDEPDEQDEQQGISYDPRRKNKWLLFFQVPCSLTI